MASYLTSNSLIESIKRKENIPTSQATFQDVDFLAFANEELAVAIIPYLLQFHQEFLVVTEDVPIVNAQESYPIPYRAIGGRLRDIFYKDDAGNMRETSRVNPDDIVWYRKVSTSFNYPVEYYLRGTDIVLANPAATGKLSLSYFLRPNQLVTEDRVAIIADIDRVNGIITVQSVPSVFQVSSKMDFLEASGGHRTLDFDVLPTAINSATKTITFAASDIPTQLSVGDHLALAGECIVPQIPDELHSYLAQRVALQCLKALGDQAGIQMAAAKVSEMEVKLASVVDNRVDGNPVKVVNLRGPVNSARLKRLRRF